MALFSAIGQAQTIYVDASASGANSGASWANAYTDLQTALGAATSSSEIWIAAGTYKPHASDRNIAFAIPSGVELYGGFNGTETMLTQRNPTTNVTVLSGDLSGNDNTTILETEPTRNDNSYHLVTIIGTQTGVVIDGFTLTGANANGVQVHTSAANSYSTKRGGAIYVDKTTSGTLTASVRNCVFEKNTAAQAACYAHWNHWGVGSTWMDVDFTNCVFRNNYSAEYGIIILAGGATYGQRTRGEWVNNLFHDNSTGSKGGVLYVSGTTANANKFVNNTFHNNVCATAADGDAVYANNASSVRFHNNIFTGVTNEAFYVGGASANISNNQIEGGANIGVNTIDQTATYTNAAAGDFSLTDQSYAVDAGDNAALTTPILAGTYSTDLAGNTRTQNTEVDLGALESNLDAPTLTTPSSYSKHIQEPDFALNTTSNSTGTISYSVLSGTSVQVAGNMVSIVDTGETVIEATITAAAGYSVARKEITVDVAVLRWYVDASATGAGTGFDWTDAFTTVEDAVNAPTDESSEIWVAAGTYKPTSTADRAISFNLKDNHTVYGGFAGTETMLTQRDAATNVTILSGDLSGNDNSTILDTEPTRNDNSYHLIKIVGNQTGVILDGFTLTGVNANGGTGHTSTANSYSNKRGGAVYVDRTSTGTLSASISNCIFEKNTAIEAACYAHWNHWGIASTWMDVDFTNCVFRNNYSADLGIILLAGGASYNQRTRGEWVNNLFYNNTTANKGGVLYVSGTNANLNTFVNNTFHNNVCTNAAHGDVVYASSASSVKFENNIFAGNTNDAFSITGTSPTIRRNLIEGGSFVTGTNNVYKTAGFTNAAAADFTLTNQSYAVGTGDNSYLPAGHTTDFAGNTRIQNTTIDMGAYESNLDGATLVFTNNFTKAMSDPDFSIAATSNSSGAITYTVVEGISIQLTGAMADIVDAGTSIIEVNVAGDATHNPAVGYITVDVVANNFFVDKDATGDNTGESWTNAFNKLEDALAATGQTEVWVATGTYKPAVTARDSFYVVPTGYKIYGGFDGTETERTQRDPSVNFTVLTGDLNGNDNGVISTTEPSRSDNSYHLIYIKGSQSGVVIDGFIFNGVNANGPSAHTSPSNSYSHKRGGAIYVDPSPGNTITAIISNCIFERNTAEEAACYAVWGRWSGTNSTADVDFVNCIFRNNHSTKFGQILISGSTTYNMSRRGDIVNCLFYDNSTTEKAGVLYLGGSTACNYTVVNNTFYNNECTNGTDGDAVYATTASSVEFYNNIFYGMANDAFYITGAAPTITNNLIQNGSALGTNTTTADPMVVSVAGGNFSLSAASPALDQGNNTFIPAGITTDLAGNARILNTTVDLGAYEGMAVVSSVEDLNEVKNEMVKVYPNPTRMGLTIDTEEAIETIQVYNLNGQLLKQLQGNQRQVNVAELPAGAYILQIQTSNALLHSRFVKE
ncbi:MAG: T9SS type A sorting domain-containing protein [Aureispira sp.]|nr:T9SS type A sorting domain-containing protein [Aureispira sp.]